MLHPECQRLSNHATLYLAGGPATLSKHSLRYPATLTPLMLMCGEGAKVWCADRHRYLDCVSALGPVLLGHNHSAVTRAVQEQAATLVCSTMSTALEGAVAERICSIIPGAEQVRTATNGKDVNEAAVKLARNLTGHASVLYCGYAGGFSDYLCTTDKTGGILNGMRAWNRQIAWRDWAALEQEIARAVLPGGASDLAAIMLEVPPELPSVSRAETAATLQQYKDAAHAAGALFILDEVVTGFRYGLGGAQAYYGVTGDLCTFSKALANGLPLAAITGPRDLLHCFEGGAVFLSTTFGGHPVSLAACDATLRALMETDALTRLKQYGCLLYDQMSTLFTGTDMPAVIRGNYARFVIDWHGIEGVTTADELRTLWLQEMISRGILCGVPWFPMCCYTKETVVEIVHAAQETCGVISSVLSGKTPLRDVLQCPVITNVFERYSAPHP